MSDPRFKNKPDTAATTSETQPLISSTEKLIYVSLEDDPDYNSHIKAIQKLIKSLDNEIRNLNKSCFACIFNRKTIAKQIERDVLDSLLHAETLDDLKSRANDELKNPQLSKSFYLSPAGRLIKSIAKGNTNKPRSMSFMVIN